MHMLTPEESERIEEYYRRYNVKLFRVAAASFNNNRAMAEDAVNQVFLVACQNPQKLIEHPRPEAWLMTTLRYVIFHEKRYRARFQSLFIGILPLVKQDSFESKMKLDALYPGLTETPAFQIIKWFAIDGYSVADIAEKLGISINACKKRMERARKTLSAMLKDKT